MNSLPSSPEPSPHDLFLQALEKSAPGERTAFLDGACRGDAALRAAVEELLAKHPAGSSLQDTVSSQPTVVSRPAERPGESIGRYKLLQELGEGGFGTVWMAEQVEPVSRRVALKIIKLGMDTREVIARFEAERQALAMMDHPNIAKIFDAGATDQGRPFFVMELVKGLPITQFCDEEGLGMGERLALFGDVCSAINHAHQKGVIHRDIKPSNVMVTLHGDKPVVKVIDFGIAKATQGALTDKTIFTRVEQFIGTPVYMSPEQASMSGLDVDTRSDIYALGILLYELLTGKPPFDAKSLAAAGYEEMRRIIREVEPPRPSSRLSTIAGDERTQLAKLRHIAPEKLKSLIEPDLDWIVMKAIDKDRKRRYETANALALDIQHFLAEEPVSATPPGAGYRMRKFARRHRVALRVAAAIVLLLVAGTVTSTLLAIRAIKAEHEVTKQLESTAAARADAEQIVHFLTGILESPDPERSDRQITVAQSLDRAALLVDTSLDAFPERQAGVKAALGRAYSALGRAEQAIPLQKWVLAWFREKEGDEHPDTMKAMKALAASLDFVSQRSEAIELYRKILAWHERQYGPDHLDTVLIKAELGRILWFNGDKKGGLQIQEEALRRCRMDPGLNDPRTQSLLHWVAVAYEDAGRVDEARRMDEEHLELSTKLLGPKHPLTLHARSAVAQHITDPLRRRAAQEGIIADSTEIFGGDHPYTLAMRAQLASSVEKSGDIALALSMFEEDYKLMVMKNSARHADTIWVMSNLASLLHQNGAEARALEMREQIVNLSREVFGERHYNTLGAQMRLGESYEKANRLPEAMGLREKILPVLEEVRGLSHADTSWVRHSLLKNYEKSKNPEAAVRLRRGMVAASAEKNGADAIETMHLRHTLAYEIRVSGQPEEGLAYSKQTLDLARNLPASPDNAILLRYCLFCTAWHADQSGLQDQASLLNEERVKMNPKLSPVRSVIIPDNAAWKWFHPLDGQDPEIATPGFHVNFPKPDFDDRAWTESTQQGDGFGYGGNFKGVDIGTPPPEARHNAYFRHRFQTTKPLTHLELRARRDDGLIVYLDGRRILRDNVPDMPDTWSLNAIQGLGEKELEVTMAWPIPGELAAGEHTLAISVHLFNGVNSNLRLGNVTLVEVEPEGK